MIALPLARVALLRNRALAIDIRLLPGSTTPRLSRCTLRWCFRVSWQRRQPGPTPNLSLAAAALVHAESESSAQSSSSQAASRTHKPCTATQSCSPLTRTTTNSSFSPVALHSTLVGITSSLGEANRGCLQPHYQKAGTAGLALLFATFAAQLHVICPLHSLSRRLQSEDRN